MIDVVIIVVLERYFERERSLCAAAITKITKITKIAKITKITKIHFYLFGCTTFCWPLVLCLWQNTGSESLVSA